MKWTIRRKLLLSFICMALLTITASSYAVYRLYDLTRKADYIVNNNVSFMEQVRTLVATVVAMEEAAKNIRSSKILILLLYIIRVAENLINSSNGSRCLRKMALTRKNR